jgi:hypothetical protein
MTFPNMTEIDIAIQRLADEMAAELRRETAGADHAKNGQCADRQNENADVEISPSGACADNQLIARESHD